MIDDLVVVFASDMPVWITAMPGFDHTTLEIPPFTIASMSTVWPGKFTGHNSHFTWKQPAAPTGRS